MRRRTHRASGPGMGDRFWHAVGCAAIGALLGAFVAAARMYFGHAFSPAPMVILAAGCAVLGLFVGDAFADLLAAPLHFFHGFLVGAWDVDPPESDRDAAHLPAWLKWVFWLGFLLGLLFWLDLI